MLRFLFPGAVLLAGPVLCDVEEFQIMVADMDAPVQEMRQLDFGTGDWFADIHGASYLDVTPGMTAGDLINTVNYKTHNRAAWLEKFLNIPELLTREDLNAYKFNWNRDDGGRLFHEMTESRKSGTADLFMFALYGGQILDPRMTLRSAGIGSNSKVFFRRAKNGHLELKLREIKFRVGSGRQSISEVWESCPNCREESISFWENEPPLNVMYVVALKMGMQVDQVKLRFIDDSRYDDSQKLELGVDNIMSIDTTVPSEYEYLYKRMKGNFAALVEREEVKSTYTGFIRFRDGNNVQRYSNEIMAQPFPQKSNQLVVTAPKDDCDCMSVEEFKNRYESNLPKKLRHRYDTYGRSCEAHDSEMKYCREERQGKENRECWCPLKWCFTSERCGTPSKQFEGLYYSYDYCGKQDLDCLTDYERGTETEEEFDDFVIEDIWDFTSLQRFLLGLVHKTEEENTKDSG